MLPENFRPMLADKVKTDKLQFPLMVSPKLDGIRCVTAGGVAYSRSLIPIPNRHVQATLAELPGLDGELIVGSPTAASVCQTSMSGVMSAAGEPDFTFYVFDRPTNRPDDLRGFKERLNSAESFVTRARALSLGKHFVDTVPHHVVHDLRELLLWEERIVAEGFEGVMLRDPRGPYKWGRSTAREGYLLKMKRWHDAEAVVVGVVEQMHNGNEATRDELGRTKRSSAKAGKTGKGTLGALVCEYFGSHGPVQFELGTGFDDATRAALWAQRETLNGSLVKFKFQELTKDDVPRFPVFLGMRDRADMAALEFLA